MSTLKITQSQFDRIVLYEERKRNIFLTENAKDLALTIALLSGIKLTGQNEYTVNNLIKDKKNMTMVKNTLEDENKIKELVDALTEKGMKNPEGSLSKNADNIVKKFNEISEKEKLNLKLDFLTSNNLKNLVE
jgi:phage protein D